MRRICSACVFGSMACPVPGEMRLTIFSPSRSIALPISTCAWKNTSLSPMHATAGTTPAFAAYARQM